MQESEENKLALENKKQQNILEPFINYFFANIIKSVSFFGLMLGGLIFLKYFILIRYIPSLTLEQAIIPCAVIAIIIIFLAAFISINFLLIGIPFKFFISIEEIIPELFKHDNKKRNINFYFQWFALPIILLLITIFLYFLMASYFNLSYEVNNKSFLAIIFVGPILVGIIYWHQYGIQSYIIKIYDFFKNKSELKPVNSEILCKKVTFKKASDYFFIFLIVWILANCLNILMFFLILSFSDKPSGILIESTFITIISLMFNSIWVFKNLLTKSKSYFAQLIILVFLLISFFLLGNDYEKIIIKRFGWGNMPNVSLIVNAEGYAIIKNHGGQADSIAPNLWRTEKLTVLSSLGSEYFLELTNNAKQSHERFTLPQTDIISRSSEATNKTENPKLKKSPSTQ